MCCWVTATAQLSQAFVDALAQENDGCINAVLLV